MTENRSTELQAWSTSDRLKVFNVLTAACTHMYSKGRFQTDRFDQVSPMFIRMAQEDPEFLAHFTSWALAQDSKDMKVLSTFFNALSDADGQPFFEGSSLNKPNYRAVSAAALQMMDPHLALRVLELTRYKFGITGYISAGAHYPSFMKTAFQKYLIYRENQLSMIRGIRKSGGRKKYIKMYKLLHMAPTNESAAILNWKQRGRNIETEVLSFDGLNSLEIARKILDEKLSPTVAISMIDNMDAVVAQALLKNATGNQAVIMQNLFRSRGFLEIPEINELFSERVTEAGTSVDRIDTLAKDLTSDEKEVMNVVRAKVRKEQTGDIGKVFLHIDGSVSMQPAIEFAKESASIIAESIQNPEENFGWGIFKKEALAKPLPNPERWTKEHVYQALYGKQADGGGTNCLACYPPARLAGAEIDIYFTDEGHNIGNITTMIQGYHNANPNIPMPKAAVVVHFDSDIVSGCSHLSDALNAIGIPTAVIKPEALKESAMVGQAIRMAIKGASAIIENIMETPLLTLPKWWNDQSLATSYRERLNA